MSVVPTLRRSWPLLALAAVALLASSLSWRRGLESVQAQEMRQRWEYAELSQDGTASMAGGAEASVTWSDSQRSVSAGDFRGLARKLGMTVRRDDSTSLLNAVGAQGWEVAGQSATSWSMTPSSTTGALGQTQYWTLKRPR